MTDHLVTVVVVPRERFSMTRPALERMYEVTPPPFRLVYVDGGSPRHVREYLEGQARERGFKLIRTDHYLAPNEARNLAARAVGTKYVVFIDNDVLVTPGWLEALVSCAEETGAWAVGPVYCIGPPELETIHMAAGTCHILEEAGRGKAVLVSTHSIALAEQVADRIGIITRGALVAEGTMDELRERAVERAEGGDLEQVFLTLTREEAEGAAPIVPLAPVGGGAGPAGGHQ